ncbi:branched-chain amino acid transport system substrate-binding protein [Tepidamorphus gemmatus]|uniref:Branched-chain amino acid transport system substrate-binding protein n=1 Tax=Tepidamorphus gemmatus TaxID=747076 RepID=A0A4R3MJ74_9HYPH|nr:ABC transporter substrate-binding protein [Tepidamorphus gemmatus]TCT13434.1 branched-chain amino acid transport system substrate-binding protein [Tepidamorphus gemmatus]
MTLRRTALAAAFLAATALPAASAEYVMSASADYSGPFADVMPNAMSGINTIVDWWNREVGEGLGVKVNVKIYDMRYDPAVIARTWPSILASDKPILHLGFGSPDLTTLMKRLPDDKVPMLIGTAMVGLVWTPDGWHYSIRPTYSHEFAGLFAHLQERKGDKLRIGAVSTQTLAGFVDQVNGIKHLAETYPDRFELVDTQWVEASPVSVTSNVRALAEKEPDVLLVGGTTAQVIAVAKALQELGLDIPIVMSTHNGLAEVSKGISLSELEGSMSAFSFAAPGKAELPIRDVFEANKKDGEWGTITAQSAAQAILALRVLEKAIETVGADNVTGEAMRQALLDGTFTEADLLGALPTVDFDTSAPFPIGKIKSTAEIVVGGEIKPLGEDWMDVPELTKW